MRCCCIRDSAVWPIGEVKSCGQIEYSCINGPKGSKCHFRLYAVGVCNPSSTVWIIIAIYIEDKTIIIPQIYLGIIIYEQIEAVLVRRPACRPMRPTS